ncbi:lysM and putative peptidoglycan-binding domain-containing protein 2 [Chrysoperla carnea]|uniref:lysM and putative peptidoglycan-binding domain-containing protein 2 n=1 Tax=Chrysoperla carnea TaxID=189513 RepID=UPI001D0832B4|nr:lysM and putative peptidoglycan-binding domain-containing protein 2 [Chrysoperla carnea]
MAESELYEKLSIRDSVKSLKKYGSTSKHMKRHENLIKHSIESTDTLQGIALKYGVTTEQIRRTNRLWASDSLFLREYLLIPVAADSPFSPSEVNRDMSIVNMNNNSSSSKPVSPSSDLEEPTIDDFLSNIDHSIANTKKEVRKSQGNSEFISDDDYECSYVKKKHAVSRLRQASTTSGSSNSTSSAIMKSMSHPPPDILSIGNNSSSTSYQQYNTQPVHTVPMVITQTGRKLRTSLQRLEQQQDEMFEL